MWSLFKKNTEKKLGVVSLTMSDNGVFVSHLNENSEITVSVFLPCHGLSECEVVLTQFVQKYQLELSDCAFVLQSEQYRLLLIDKPDVKAEELREAVRWAVLELVEYPTAETVIDIFDAPSCAGQEKIYVVVTHLPLLQKISRCIERSGLNLKLIDIMELALTHGLSYSLLGAQSVGLLFRGKADINFIVVHDNALVLQRAFDVLSYQTKSENSDAPVSSQDFYVASADAILNSPLLGGLGESSDEPGSTMAPSIEESDEKNKNLNSEPAVNENVTFQSGHLSDLIASKRDQMVQDTKGEGDGPIH